MKIKVVFCGCNGLKLLPQDLDISKLPTEVEGDVDVQYSVMHPALCDRGGVDLLTDLLRGSDQQAYFLVAGCGPELQPEYMGHVFKATGFPRDHYIPVDISGKSNSTARDAVLERIGQIVARQGEGSMAFDGFGG